jgi:hypothetical protein
MPQPIRSVFRDKPEMTADLAEAYTCAGNDNGVFVIPAGLTFAKSVQRRPEFNLHAPDRLIGSGRRQCRSGRAEG